MKGRVLVFIVGVLLIGANLYAADGDLIVNNKLGVGNTAPTYKLDVTGDARFTGTLQGGSVPWARLTSFPSACATGQFVRGVGATLTCATPAGSGVSGSGTANYISKWTGTSSLGNSLIYDNGTNVGIGTTTPTSKLTVKGPASTAGAIQIDTTGNSQLEFLLNGVQKWALVAAAGGGIGFYQWPSSIPFFITSANNLGIGTMTPSYQLQLSTDSAAKPSTNTWTIASDARLKKDIQSYTKGLKEILQISPVTYKYNGKGGIGHNKFKIINPVTGTETETETIDTELLSKTNVGVIA